MTSLHVDHESILRYNYVVAHCRDFGPFEVSYKSTSAIILAAMPPIGPPNAVPNVGATAPTIFFNKPFISYS